LVIHAVILVKSDLVHVAIQNALDEQQEELAEKTKRKQVRAIVPLKKNADHELTTYALMQPTTCPIKSYNVHTFRDLLA